MNFKYMLVFALTVFLLMSVFVPSASAHGAYVKAVSDEEIKVYAWYQGGMPISNAECEVYIKEKDGKETEELYVNGKTDSEGYFSFKKADNVTKYLVKVKDGEHLAQKVIDADAAESNTHGTAVEQKPDFITIFAGLGWILGLTGIALYIFTYKKMKKKN